MRAREDSNELFSKQGRKGDGWGGCCFVLALDLFSGPASSELREEKGVSSEESQGAKKESWDERVEKRRRL